MKKKILGAVLIAAMVLAASWNFNQSKNEMELSDLALANVEALARGEDSYKLASEVYHSVSVGSDGSPVHTYVCPEGTPYLCPK